MDDNRRLLQIVKSEREKKERIEKVSDIVKKHNSVIESKATELVDEYADGLDNFVKKTNRLIRDIKDGRVTKYSQLQLEIQVLELASEMYKVADGAEIIAGQSDVAQLHRQEVFARFYANAAGTIPDKTNEANEKALIETLTAKIYERAASRLRSKVKSANRVLEALKKVLTSRIVQAEVWRKEAPVYDEINFKDEVAEADEILDKE